MKKRVVCIVLVASLALWVSGCWGPFKLTESFNKAIDKIHDDSTGGMILIQAGSFPIIPVVIFIHNFCMFIDYIILNPISLFSGQPASGDDY